MDVWQEINWFAVQAKPYRENLAAASVAKLDVEVFLPRIKQEQMVCGVVRIVTKPLFTGYFFARFSPLLSLDGVHYARGVLRVLGTSRFPIPVEQAIVASIQQRVQSDGFIRIEKERFQPGDKVIAEQGLLAGWMGCVERELDDGKRVSILLDAISKARVLIEKRWLTRVAQEV